MIVYIPIRFRRLLLHEELTRLNRAADGPSRRSLPRLRAPRNKATSGIARCSAILQVRGLQLRDFVFTHLAGLALAREDPHGFPSLGYAWTTDQRTAARRS